MKIRRSECNLSRQTIELDTELNEKDYLFFTENIATTHNTHDARPIPKSHIIKTSLVIHEDEEINKNSFYTIRQEYDGIVFYFADNVHFAKFWETSQMKCLPKKWGLLLLRTAGV